MRKPEPMTQTMKLSDARQQFSQVVNQVFRKEARVIVEKSGIPVAAIISAQDLDRLERLEAERASDFTILDEIGDTFRDISPEEIERQVAKALRQIRAENRRPERAAAP